VSCPEAFSRQRPSGTSPCKDVFRQSADVRFTREERLSGIVPSKPVPGKSNSFSDWRAPSCDGRVPTSGATREKHQDPCLRKSFSRLGHQACEFLTYYLIVTKSECFKLGHAAFEEMGVSDKLTRSKSPLSSSIKAYQWNLVWSHRNDCRCNRA
jgi:hypothetical protein